MRQILKHTVCNSIHRSMVILLMIQNGKQLGWIAVDQWWKGTKISPVLLCGQWEMKQETETISEYFTNGLKIKIHPDRLYMNQQRTGNIQMWFSLCTQQLNLFQNMQKTIHLVHLSSANMLMLWETALVICRIIGTHLKNTRLYKVALSGIG